ncbi:MAG: CvpA family protein [Alphaproteobacteria bacterium]|nr:CvpA family protein [Alphaproteobacteria bacterium]
MGGLNPVDIGIVVVLLLSGTLALFRGLVKEVLSIAAWVTGFLITAWSYDWCRKLAAQYVGEGTVASLIASIGVFVVVMILLSLVIHFVVSRVAQSALGPLDRSLGFVFGLVRGVLIVCVAYLGLAWLAPAKDHPEVVQKARLRPFVADTTAVIVKLLPDHIRRGLQAQIDEARRHAEAAAGTAAQLQQAGKALAPLVGAAEKGYRAADRQQLDRLIQGQAGK